MKYLLPILSFCFIGQFAFAQPEFNMGQVPGSDSCEGKLFDTGGAGSDYSNFENGTFEICPSDPHACITLDIINFDIEDGEDELNIYAGQSTSDPLIGSATGISSGSDFKVQASSNCVLVEFKSDGFITDAGFELTWTCSNAACNDVSLDDIDFVPSVPFSRNGQSTCENASSFGDNLACPNLGFLGGPEKVYTYNSIGRECVSINLTGADAGTGILVLNGLPTDANSLCVASSVNGSITSANLQIAGTYYIIVANALGCTDFDIQIAEAECDLSPALLNALCNPINNCAMAMPNSNDPLPTILKFEDGFQDIAIQNGVNNGCWDLSIGLGLNDPNFYWFSFEALADGDFGFIIESADVPSDLDYNIWGPFTNEQVCNDPQTVVNFISNNQPVRSSYAGGTDPTGLVRTHPVTGIAVTDEFDCDPIPSPNGDDFTKVIEAQQGEVYLVLLNDWQDNILTNGIEIDWSPSSANTVLTDPITVIQGDTAICPGTTAQLEISSNTTSITWTPNSTLSCTNCLNPVATPTTNTTYTAAISGACQQDTFEITVRIFDVDLGADRAVCRNEIFDLVAGESYPNATYSWDAPAGFLSCTDCPDPVVEAITPGTYTIGVTLTSSGCILTDEMTLIVRNELAPTFSVIANDSICIGDNINIGGPDEAGVNHNWTDGDGNFVSNQSDPQVMPNVTTTYFVDVDNAGCPLVSKDSVLITVFDPAVVNLASPVTICEGDTVILATTTPEKDVTYSWSPATGLDDADIANPTAIPNSTTTYTLTATRGACVVTESVTITVTEINAEILAGDTLLVCLGETPDIGANVRPGGATFTWTPNDFLTPTVGANVRTTATDDITYYLTVTVPGCIAVDSILVKVDSLPMDLSIMPQDTTICEGENVILTSPIFEPAIYEDIMFEWMGPGQLTGDSLYNMVAQPTDTTTYIRMTQNGGCTNMDSTTVNVKPITVITVEPMDPLLCAGESVDLQITNDEMLEELEWTPMQGLSCFDCLDPTASPSFTTDYMIMAEVDGCPAQGQVTVTVLNDPQAPNIEGVVCEGTSINLNPFPLPSETYTWSSNPNDPTLDPSERSPIVTPTQNTTYTVTIDNMACDPQTFTIDVAIIGDATLAVDPDQSVCAGDELSLTANGSQPGNYRWIDESTGSTVGNSAILNITPTESTTYQVVYSYGPTDAPCGTLTEEVDVVVINDFIIDIETSPPGISQVNQGEEIGLIGNIVPNIPNATIVWTDQNGTEVGTGDRITVMPSIVPITTYTATVTTPEGCTSSNSISITVLPPRYDVPNAFTPDNDGVNDDFRMFYEGNVNLSSLQVFDRWGEMVYETTNIDEGWDGRLNGKDMPSDVYVYLIILDLPEGETVLKGDLTLLR